MKVSVRTFGMLMLLACTAMAVRAQNAVASDTIVADSSFTRSADALHSSLSLQQHIQMLVDESQLDEVGIVGMMIYDLTTDSILFRLNEKKTLRPASTMKVLTAVTALDCLGSDYRYTTSLMMTGEVVDSVLVGDIYIKGGMDPLFARGDMEAFSDTLLMLGIRSVRGNIVADRSMYRGERYGSGWCWDDNNPILTPMLYERKDAMAESFAAMLRERGVTIEGTGTHDTDLESKGSELVTSCVFPEDAVVLCTCRHLLTDVMMPMMKKSDNLFAETVFYQIGHSDNETSTADNARRKMNTLILSLGYFPDDYLIADGSGLSLYNHLSPELEVAILRYAFSKPDVFDALYHSLPIAGLDGTLAKRMRGTPAQNVLRAKTGTVTSVSSLAGYAPTRDGHLLAFSIMNQGVLSGQKARTLQNRICAAMCAATVEGLSP